MVQHADLTSETAALMLRRLQRRPDTVVVELCLSHNRLTLLPAFLPVTLTLLDVSHNALDVLPDLRELVSLRRLNVAGNGIRSLLGLTFCTGLEALDVSNNRYGAGGVRRGAGARACALCAPCTWVAPALPAAVCGRT